jgi:hypothetical protein
LTRAQRAFPSSTQWLAYAEDQSRRNIALLQDSGVDATACAQMHAIARIKARRELREKLEGLVEFWSADVHARILRRLSGLAESQDAPTTAETDRDGPDSRRQQGATGKE